MARRHKLVTKKERELLLREKVMDLGNIVLSGLLLAQFFQENFNVWLAMTGIITALLAYIFSYKL